MVIYQIIQIVDDVQGEIEDLLKNVDQNDPVVIGQLLAYAETLSIIKSACIIEADKIGLDCDMDAMIFGAVQNGKKVEFERTVRTRNLMKK